MGEVLGTYRLLRVLGRGGMGTVYEAEHVRLGRRVALKILHPDCPLDVRRRFFTEARALGTLQHEHLVEVLDFVEGEEGADAPAYIVMERLRGEDLSARLAREGPLSPGETLRIGAELAAALGAVHAEGLVHRDLKPANIFLAEQGSWRGVKLLDFGVAKHLGSEADPGQTQSGLILGTPHYMAPEQARGKAVDARSDIYALGVVLYLMLCAEPPFRGDNFPDLVVQQETQRPRSPGEVRGAVLPEALTALVMRCLQADPAHRPQSMNEVRAELERVAASLLPDQAVTPRAVDGVLRGPTAVSHERPAKTAPVRPRSRSRRASAAALGALVAVGALAVLGALGWWRSYGEGELARGHEAAPLDANDGRASIEPRRAAPPGGDQALEASVVMVRTVPPGARILRGDTGALLGSSPLRVTLPADEVLRVRVGKPGYGERELELRQQEHGPGEITVTLAPLAPAERPAQTGGGAYPGREPASSTAASRLPVMGPRSHAASQVPAANDAANPSSDAASRTPAEADAPRGQGAGGLPTELRDPW